MPNEYTNNHYVPVWYLKRFIPQGQKDQELFYLDRKPGEFKDPRGIIHQKKALHRQGLKFCFSKDDLYTINFRSAENKDIEKIFFGKIDYNGRSAVDYFTNFAHPSVNGEAFDAIMMYMSTQKLRTPKGLEWLTKYAKATDRQHVLRLMLELRQMYCATWTDSIWQIADATNTNTKFIISDHPVTVYNRKCGPFSRWCRGHRDPDITFHATHTIFPLSLEKILILTNLSWVRNPYQNELSYKPNPALFRDTIFKFTEIQTLRHLSEQEVCEINFVIKMRSFRYIAAAKKEWLYPEKNIPSKDWGNLGHGYLFMPDPRPVHLGGEIMIGHRDGTVSGFDEYGRRPWDRDYGKESKSLEEGKTLYRFMGEFARLFGPYRRGRTFNAMSLDNECDDEEFHEYHLGLDKRKHS